MQVCTSLQTDNHASTPPLNFLQAGCPSYRPTNSVKALKADTLLQALRPALLNVREMCYRASDMEMCSIDKNVTYTLASFVAAQTERLKEVL